MRYEEQVRHLFETEPGFASAIDLFEKLKEVKRPRVLNFSHHDLDGITSAFIVRRLLERHLNAEVVTKLPPYFKLREEEFWETLEGEDRFDLLLITDKGTFGYYDDFLKHIERVLVIDHHPLDGRPKHCTVVNPSAERSVPAAASLICHMLATKLGLTDDYDDFAALIGCRGDFVFDPVRKTSADFAKPFIEREKERFRRAFEIRPENPTMYDLVDRDRTALINQIGEVLHAGCLAHLYNQALGIDVSYGPELVFDFLLEVAKRGERLAEFCTITDVLGHMPKGQMLSRVFEQYKSDWNMLNRRAENTVFLDEIRGVGIYLLFAKEAPEMQVAQFPAILPFVALTRLDGLKLAGGHPHVMMIIFCPKERGVHISMRGGDGVLDCGAMCSQLASHLRELYPEQEGIGGGGHDRAAECMVDKPVPMYAVMHELLALVQEMGRLAETLESGEVTQKDVEKARLLGLARNF
jgi:hypothetical protein